MGNSDLWILAAHVGRARPPIQFGTHAILERVCRRYGRGRVDSRGTWGYVVGWDGRWDEWTLVGHGDTWLDGMGAGELRPAPGNRQLVNKVPGKIDDEPNQMMLLSDMILAWDPSFRGY